MIDFEQDYTLENGNVRLSPLTKGDWKNLLHFSTSEPDLWKFSLSRADSPEKLSRYIESALEMRKNRNGYPFIVFDKRQNRYAGCTRFYDVQPQHSALSLGHTWYGKDFQGTGLNKDCKYLLLEFAFDTLHMERVEFRADNNNERSIRALKSIGCTPEGILRSNARKPDGGRRDSIVLSILRDEWEHGLRARLRERIRRQ